MSIRQFIQIPTVLNAIQFHKTEEDWKKLKSFVELEGFIDIEAGALLPLPNGNQAVVIEGDWIVKYSKNHYLHYTDEEFRKTFMEVIPMQKLTSMVTTLTVTYLPPMALPFNAHSVKH